MVSGGVYVSGKVLLGHEAQDVVGSHGSYSKSSAMTLVVLYYAIRLKELIALGYGCDQFFGLDVSSISYRYPAKLSASR